LIGWQSVFDTYGDNVMRNIEVGLTIEELGMDKVKMAGCYDAM